jgi:YHS domain-containing protein
MLKQTTTIAACALLAMCLFARAEDAATTQPAAAARAAPATQPFNKYCAVNTKDLVDPKVTYVYKGKVYGFCCADCIKDFQKDPEKYAAKAK